MRAALRYWILRDFARIGDVRNVDHVDDPAGRDALLVKQVELRWKDFIAQKDIVLVAKYGVGPGEPAIAIKLVVVEPELAHELRSFRAASLYARSNIQNHQPVAPVREVGHSILHINVVQV